MGATEQPIIALTDRQLVRQELTPELSVHKTNEGNNEIYTFRAAQAPQTMCEVGHLREESFRANGGGTGLECDVDKYNLMDDDYIQLVVWSPGLEKIIGGHRYTPGEAVLRHWEWTDTLATLHIFGLSEKFVHDYLPYMAELSRSSVSQELQMIWTGLMSSICTLDNLWDGLGVLTIIHSEIKYFLDRVTMYKTYNRYCRNLILKFMETYFSDKDHLVFPMNLIRADIDPTGIDRLFAKSDLKNDYHTLKAEVYKHNINIPSLFNAYISLTPKIHISGMAVNDRFGDVEETGLLTPIADAIPEKKERHIDTYQRAKWVTKTPLLMTLVNELGATGGRAAQRHLLSWHIRPLEINWRDPFCEIDIIVSDGRHLLTVKVKGRMEYIATGPLDVVDQARAHQMTLGNMRYAQRIHTNLPIRYDVIRALYCPASDLFEIKYHEGHFSIKGIALQEVLPRGSIQP